MIDVRTFRPRAVIFDLDGTLTDNMPWHTKAFEAFAARHGLPPVTMELRRRIDGKRNDEIFPLLFERPLSEPEIRAFEAEKEGAYRELSRARLAPMQGAARLLDALEQRGIPVAVATSAPASNVDHTLEEIGLAGRLPIIVRGDQVAHGKPFPDVFLLAARTLRTAPEDCLAFEDAPLGVQAAHAARMACVAITSSFDATGFHRSDARPDDHYSDFDAFLAGAGRWLTEVHAT